MSELPSPQVMAAKLNLFDEDYLIERYQLRRFDDGEPNEKPNATLRRLVKREKADHYYHEKAVFLSRTQVLELEKRCTRRGRERVHDLPAGRAHPLASRYVGVVLGSRRYQREWARTRMREDQTYRLNARMRKAVHGSLRGLKRGRPWCVLTGYSVADLKAHLEARFAEGMTWENYGKWHVDHIRPLSSFNITDAECEDFKAAWALSNLQPLWASDNLRKHAKWPA